MTKKIKLYKWPESLDEAEILDDSVLDAYNKSIRFYSKNAKETLGKFDKADGELTNSNPFMLVHLLNSGLLPDKTRLATREDLEKIIHFDSNGSFLGGRYADFGLALRTAGDSYQNNDLLAKRLANQLEERAIKLDKGKLIPFSVLKNQESKDSAYGLVFDLSEQVDKNIIQDLVQFKWDNERDEGLASAYLYWDAGWISYDGRLGYSDGDGRVVIISGEASAQKILDEEINKIKKETEAQINEYRKREQEAIDYVRTGKLP